MYQGDPTLRGAGEKIEYTPELMREYIRCKEDIIYFAEKYFKIITIDDGEITIKLWDFQKKLLKAFVDPSPKRHAIVLASRQVGKSTISTIFVLWYALFNEDKTIAILANKEKTSKEILRRIKFAYQNLPLWLQQGIADAGWNQNSISLENGVRLLSASTSSSAIRGESISLLYLDEFAFVPQNIADDFMASVYPTISSGKTSKIILLSTPNGINHFYDIWKNAIHGENNFKPIRVKWDEVPGKTHEWKEEVINDIGLVKWRAEYECKFLGSTSTLIDPELLERLKSKQPLELKLGNLLQVFEYPKEGVMYILGVDAAKGTGLDYSVIQVLKITNEHDVSQVAVYRYNMIEPYNFAQVCIETSKFYNNAYMMIENNGEGGQVADAIWYNFEYDYILNCDKKGIGIRSTKKSKLAANLLLKRYLEHGWLDIIHKDTIAELSKYEETGPNVFKASRYDHDDCVTSLLWGLYFLTTTFFDGKNMDVHKIDDKFKIDSETESDIPVTMIVDDNDE